MLKPSEFDTTKWGCPKCGFPVDYPEEETEQGNSCSCGVWVALPHFRPGECKYCKEGVCPFCLGIESGTCEECFGTAECGACLGTGDDMEEEIEAHLLYRSK